MTPSIQIALEERNDESRAHAERLPQAILCELEKLEQMKDEAIALATVAKLAHAVAEVFPGLKLEPRIVRWTCEPVFVALFLHDLKDFRESLPVLTHLAALGFHTEKTRPFSDYHEIRRRSYNLVTPVEAEKNKGLKDYQSLNCRLRLMAFLVDEGATCRRVQTGTKQEPVYEFVCDEPASA